MADFPYLPCLCRSLMIKTGVSRHNCRATINSLPWNKDFIAERQLFKSNACNFECLYSIMKHSLASTRVIFSTTTAQLKGFTSQKKGVLKRNHPSRRKIKDSHTFWSQYMFPIANIIPTFCVKAIWLCSSRVKKPFFPPSRGYLRYLSRLYSPTSTDHFLFQ